MRRGPWLLLLAMAIAIAGCEETARPPQPTTAPKAPSPRPRTDAAAVAARARVPVLCYHQVRPLTAADGPQARPLIVSPAGFAEQMRALDRAGYRPVTADALVAHLRRGAPLPRKPVLLTFDDASAGQFTHALPVLRRHRFVATFFVMTVVLDKPEWLSSRQVRKLNREGMTIAAHTYDHYPVPSYRGAAWRRQLERPKRKLERIVGHPVRLFAYPYGQRARRAYPRLRAAGYEGGFQLDQPLDRRHPGWSIRRILVPEWTGTRLLAEMRRQF